MDKRSDVVGVDGEVSIQVAYARTSGRIDAQRDSTDLIRDAGDANDILRARADRESVDATFAAEAGTAIGGAGDLEQRITLSHEYREHYLTDVRIAGVDVNDAIARRRERPENIAAGRLPARRRRPLRVGRQIGIDGVHEREPRD